MCDKSMKAIARRVQSPAPCVPQTTRQPLKCALPARLSHDVDVDVHAKTNSLADREDRIVTVQLERHDADDANENLRLEWQREVLADPIAD